jgi:hypothetical protein
MWEGQVRRLTSPLTGPKTKKRSFLQDRTGNGYYVPATAFHQGPSVEHSAVPNCLTAS